MWEHIAAAVLSITCVCVWYIVERTQTRNCCAGCFRRLGPFVVGPASTSSEVIRAVLNGWSMAAASLALHVSKTPMLYVPCLVRACFPATCIAYAPGLVSMHIMLSLSLSRSLLLSLLLSLTLLFNARLACREALCCYRCCCRHRHCHCRCRCFFRCRCRSR